MHKRAGSLDNCNDEYDVMLQAPSDLIVTSSPIASTTRGGSTRSPTSSWGSSSTEMTGSTSPGSPRHRPPSTPPGEYMTNHTVAGIALWIRYDCSWMWFVGYLSHVGYIMIVLACWTLWLLSHTHSMLYLTPGYYCILMCFEGLIWCNQNVPNSSKFHLKTKPSMIWQVHRCFIKVIQCDFCNTIMHWYSMTFWLHKYTIVT